jgi:hypothetical protein
MTEVEQSERDPNWWATPWWEDSIYQTEYQLSLEEIRVAIEAMCSLFDESWMKKALKGPFPNAVLAILCGGQGLMPFENLMWLGRIVISVSRIPSVAGRLGDLCGPKTRATLFELEVASWLVENGWNVEFMKPAKDRKTPDLKVSKGSVSSWIECKRFEPEQWEEWATELTYEIIRKIHERGGPVLPSFDILFEPRLSDLTWDDERVRRGILEEIATRIVEGITLAFSTTPAKSVSIAGIAEISVRADRDNTQRGLGGIQISPQAKMRRIAKNGIVEAARQLDGYGPGAVAVYSDFTPTQELADVVLGGLNRADASTLHNVGLVVIPASLGGAPVLWRNKRGAQSVACDELALAFASALMRTNERLLPRGSSRA